MDLNKQNSRDLKEFTSKKLSDFTDVTILSTPLPQATSTVDRRSLMQGKTRRSNQDEQNNKHRQLNFNQSSNTLYTEESSLGIIQNISTLLDESAFDELKKDKPECPERERELARMLLKKCSDPLIITTSKPDKENNVNSSNLLTTSNTVTRPSNIKNIQPTSNQLQNRQSIDSKSTSSSSIVFEPSEISARSSEFNKTPEKSEPFPSQNFSGISFNSNVAEIMAQCGEEEFLSGSKAGSQISADEMSWRKFKLPSLPINGNSNKEQLELSCFSGIIGDVDLTVDGGRVSVGEFFRRKCGGTGHLSTASASDRPSIGLNIKSPQKQRNLKSLIDDTITTEESYHPDEKEIKSADCTKEPSVMSLSSIAQVLQDLDSATPRKLVEQILDANKKKKKYRMENNNLASATYTLVPNSRASLPSSASFTNDKPERDVARSSFGNKLSLGSKNTSEFNNKSISELINEVNTLDPKLQKLIEMNLDDSFPDTTLQSENKTNDRLSIQQKSSNKSIPRAEHSTLAPPRQLSHLSNTHFDTNTHHNQLTNSTSINNESSLIHDTGPSDVSEPTISKSDASKEDTLTNSLVKNQSFDTSKVQIGKKTQELCTCLVGIPKEADFELYNGTDRWILCSLKLYQIQGEKDNIELHLPDDDILIEPDGKKSFKIGVKMPHMGKLTIAILHIPCSDMVTRTSWYMKHLMCFVPEEPSINISTAFENNVLNFQMITEDTSNSLPITFENRNSIDVPVLLSLSQNKPELFSIRDCFDDTLNSVANQRKSVHLILKPRVPLTINIDFKGISLQSFGDKILQKGVYNAEANLRVSICFKENEENVFTQIPLCGVVGSCKLDIVDTQFPLVLQPKISKIINVKNSGSIAVSATVDIVQSKENQSECRDFFICPNNIVLNGREKLALQILYKPEHNKTDSEKRAMIRIIVGNKFSFYPIIGEKTLEIEQFSSDSFQQLQRCETPQHLRPISSPTSPHSLILNRSGASGRHSPGSTASGGTVAGNIIPIRATHTALVWGSIRTGKSDTKQLTIRNTSNSKIKLLVTIKSEGQHFKFLKERQVVATSMILSLQGMESKTLSIIFAPNFSKAAAGKIIFSHYHSIRESREITGLVKVIQLFGYGGYGKIEISEAVKDTSGHIWLSLGKLNSEEILHARVRLHNTGDLTCFIKVKLSPKVLYPSVVSNWHIEPTELLLAPNQIQWISLEFRPRKDDFSTIYQTGVIQVGTLKITHGDEPTRLRIRRLYRKLKDSGQLHDKIDEQTDDFKEVIYPICKAFPGETFTQDLKLIGDSVQNLGDLCKGIIQNEVKLTIEIPADETISMLQDNMDDSQAFYSLCSDHNNESHVGGDSFMPTD